MPCNRLRPILDEIISPNQSAFVPDRLIADNALVAFECFHFIQKNKRPANAACAYKLDLSKAYDRVDWGFLEQAMYKMGFAHRWVSWILQCVTTVRYAVKFNGTLLSTFAPSRGLRQGDPLSPFLFLFVADGLSLLLDEKVRQGELTPVHVCRRAPGISHLLFADDTLLFFKADNSQAVVVKDVLKDYATSTGQLINPSKCSIMFGEATCDATQEEIKSTLQIGNKGFEDKYLGFPTPDGRMNKGRFQSLHEKIWKRILLWGENQLSMGGKEILIKSVLQAIPVYVMGLFKLPDSVCDELTRSIRNFWWGAGKGKRKTHWRSWDILTKSKQGGGMGFRDIKLFNQALLARQAWRLLDRPDSLCARVLKAKYYPNGSLIDTSFSGNASPGWRGIEFGLELLKKGIIWRIGDGYSVRIWRDPWIPRAHSRRPITNKKNCRLKWVAELLGTDGKWDVTKVQQHFLPIDVECILKIRTASSTLPDFVAWAPDKLGRFSVRSAYHLAVEIANAARGSCSSPAGSSNAWKRIWSCNVPQKVKVFAWKAATDSLATMHNKKKRNLERTARCSICAVEDEDVAHALYRCPHAKHLWLAMRETRDITWEMDSSWTGTDWILDKLGSLNKEEGAMFLMVIWRIWYNRNELTHGKGVAPVAVSHRFIVSYVASMQQIK